MQIPPATSTIQYLKMFDSVKGDWRNKVEPGANLIHEIYTIQWEFIFDKFAEDHIFEFQNTY